MVDVSRTLLYRTCSCLYCRCCYVSLLLNRFWLQVLRWNVHLRSTGPVLCVDCHCFSPPSVYMMFLCLILSVWVTGPQVECSFKIHRASVCVCGLPLFLSS